MEQSGWEYQSRVFLTFASVGRSGPVHGFFYMAAAVQNVTYHRFLKTLSITFPGYPRHNNSKSVGGGATIWYDAYQIFSILERHNMKHQKSRTVVFWSVSRLSYWSPLDDACYCSIWSSMFLACWQVEDGMSRPASLKAFRISGTCFACADLNVFCFDCIIGSLNEVALNLLS